MEYLLKDADSHLHMEISNDTFIHDGTWGNFNLGAITLSGSFMYLRNNRKTETFLLQIRLHPRGKRLRFLPLRTRDMSLQRKAWEILYRKRECKWNLESKTACLLCRLGNVTIKAKFLEKPEIADKKNCMQPLSRQKSSGNQLYARGELGRISESFGEGNSRAEQ